MRRGPLVLAHRGGAREAPENTLLALHHAVGSGADGIELDVRLAADGTAIVFHDEDLQRFASPARTRLQGASRIDELPSSELLAADLGRRRRRFRGTRIPTLAEALAAAAPLALVNLELKPTGDPWRLVESVARELVLDRAASERIVLTSFDRRTMAALRALLPDTPRGRVLERPPEDETWRDEPLVSLSVDLARTGLAAEAARSGQRVLVWTENDPRRLALWARRGVEAVITDRPFHFAAFRRGESEAFRSAAEDEVARPGVEPPEAEQVEDLAHQEAGDTAVDNVGVGDRRVPSHAR